MGHAESVSLPFPEPTRRALSRNEVFADYLDFFRSRVLAKAEGLPESELSQSRLPSGWTPLQLLKHLTFVELRWLEWGFEGRQIANPWGDLESDRWHVAAGETLEHVAVGLRTQGMRSRQVIVTHDLDEVGRPGPRWEGAEPATLERILLHLVQEYARHLGHLDIVVELIDGAHGE
jgi:uncharacterized damage-inducible protein DinB